VEEAKAIERQGHKRLLLICGEDPRKTNVKHFTDAMEAIYKSPISEESMSRPRR